MVASSRRTALRIAGAIAVAAVVGIVGPNAWVAREARGRVFADAASVPARSVAIVPGARVRKGKPLVHLEARLQAALALYRAGQVKAIFVSGNNTDASPEVNAMRMWLSARGVPAGAIIADAGGIRTRDTMNRAAGLFDVRHAVVCTQDASAARSLYLAEQAGIDAVAIGAPSQLGASARYIGVEAIKTALALFESKLREGPSALVGERTQRAALAAR
jgi:vancomycin permeability regulator SanA